MPSFNFSRGTAAGNTLRDKLGSPDGAGFQAHHLIPVKSVENRTIEQAIRSGYTAINRDFDIDDRTNGIFLADTPDAAYARNEAMHKGNDTIHIAYNNYFNLLLQDLADKYHDFGDKWDRKIDNSKSKKKAALRDKLDESIGGTLHTIIEKKIKKNTEKFLTNKDSSERGFFLNFRDKNLAEYYTLGSGLIDFQSQ